MGSNRAIFDDEGNLRESRDRILLREVEDVGMESQGSDGRQRGEEVRKEGTLAFRVRKMDTVRESDEGISLFLIDDEVERGDCKLEGKGRKTWEEEGKGKKESKFRRLLDQRSNSMEEE